MNPYKCRRDTGPMPGVAIVVAAAACLSLNAHARSEAPHGPPSAQGRGHETAPEMKSGAGRMTIHTAPTALLAGEPGHWAIRLTDPSNGGPVTSLTIEHERPVHLYVVSADLSWFNHLHPVQQGESLVVTATLPRAGTYHVFADYTPSGQARTVARVDLATGAARPIPTSVRPEIDVPNANGWIVRRVRAAPEGRPDEVQRPAYLVALMPMPRAPRSGAAAMLHFQIRDAAGKLVTDLEPYLGALGHAVVLSTDVQQLLHVHPMGENTNGDGAVVFHVTFPGPGLYKIWGQFKHRSLIITAPFVLHVAGEDSPSQHQSGHGH